MLHNCAKNDAYVHKLLNKAHCGKLPASVGLAALAALLAALFLAFLLCIDFLALDMCSKNSSGSSLNHLMEEIMKYSARQKAPINGYDPSDEGMRVKLTSIIAPSC